MSILDRIWAIFRPQQAREKTSVDELPTRKRSYGVQSMPAFSASYQRSELVRRCREMYANDPRAKKMHRVLARDIVKRGCMVVSEDAAAQEEASALIQRIGLNKLLDDWARLTARDGDSFLEIGVNEAMEIVSVTRKPTLQMERNCDDRDRFPDPEHAYWYTDELYVGLGTPKIDDPGVIWFAEWQIVHARWEHDEGNKYGTPMLAAGVKHFKKVEEGELDVAIRRKTRAGMKFVHVIEGGDEADIEAYKENNKDALDNPFAAVADYFTNKPGSIQTVQGDANLNQLDDVRHMIMTWMMAGDTPAELLGYGEDLNRDVLGEKKLEYDETLETLREWAADQLVKPLVEMQWLLKGIYPPNVAYSIEWLTSNKVTPLMVKDAAAAVSGLALLGVRQEIMAAVLAQFLPGVEAGDLFDDDALPGDADGDPGRIADQADLEDED